MAIFVYIKETFGDSLKSYESNIHNTINTLSNSSSEESFKAKILINDYPLVMNPRQCVH